MEAALGQDDEFLNVKKVEKEWWRPHHDEADEGSSDADDAARELRRAARVTRTDLTLPDADHDADEVADDSECTFTKKEKKTVFVLYDVLTPAECRRIIQRSEEEGYAVMTQFRETRTNTRVIVDDADLAERVWRRVAAHIPNTITKYGSQTWTAQGLNYRWRLCRYVPGQYCGPHVDACYKKSASERSHFTFMLYLNEGFEGGATVFLEGKRMEVRPQLGMALVFDHTINHEGEVLKSDVKYIMRSEVMYRRQPNRSAHQS